LEHHVATPQHSEHWTCFNVLLACRSYFWTNLHAFLFS
jgi:hypothetical protein